MKPITACATRVAPSRWRDPLDKDSATSQFFINVADNAFLDHGQRDFGYAVFGKVVKGMDVADKISQVPTHDVGPYQNVPSKPVVILSAKVLP